MIQQIESLRRTSSLDFVAVSYLSLNAESLVRTRGPSLEGEDSRARFLLIRAMAEGTGLVRNVMVSPWFTYRKKSYLVISFVALGHMNQAPSASDPVWCRAIGIHCSR